MRFWLLSLIWVIFAVPQAHSQQLPLVDQPQIFLALSDNLVSNDSNTIRVRFLPGTGEYTIQVAISVPKMHLPTNIDVHSWTLKTPIADWNGETLSVADHFFQSSTESDTKDRQTYVNYEQRYHIFALTMPSANGNSSFQTAPIVESTAFVHQNSDLYTVNMKSEVNPVLLGNEWTIKYNRHRNQIIMSWRVSAGFGLTMQNQNVQNYYPSANTGFLLTF